MPEIMPELCQMLKNYTRFYQNLRKICARIMPDARRGVRIMPDSRKCFAYCRLLVFSLVACGINI